MTMLNNPWVLTAIVLAALAYVVVKRSIGEPLNVRDLMVPPLILIVLGVRELMEAEGLTAVDLGWLICVSVVGAVCGGARAATLRLYLRDGVLWQRYTRRTFVVWPVSLLVSGGFGLLATTAGMSNDARSVMLSIGVSLAGEGVVAGVRGAMTGRRFSPVGRDSGAAHQTVLREAAQRMRSIHRR